VSQLARATVVTSRRARRDQGKAVRRLILAEVENQERSYVKAMQTLVQDYLLPLEQADPSIVSYQMMRQLSCNVRDILEVHSQLLDQLQIVQAKWEEAEALGDLITKTFSEVNLFNIYSGYVNNLAGLQKNFKQEAETNQEFARFLKVSSPSICQGLTFKYAGDWQQFGIKFGLVFTQPEAGAKTSPAKDAVGATAEENSKRSP